MSDSEKRFIRDMAAAIDREADELRLKATILRDFAGPPPALDVAPKPAGAHSNVHSIAERCPECRGRMVHMPTCGRAM